MPRCATLGRGLLCFRTTALEVITRLSSYWPLYQARGQAEGCCRPWAWFEPTSPIYPTITPVCTYKNKILGKNFVPCIPSLSRRRVVYFSVGMLNCGSCDWLITVKDPAWDVNVTPEWIAVVTHVWRTMLQAYIPCYVARSLTTDTALGILAAEVWDSNIHVAVTGCPCSLWPIM